MRNFLCSMVMFAACSAYGSIIYDDNKEHTIDFVEDFVVAINDTTLNIVDGAEMILGVVDNSTANISGGIIYGIGISDTGTAYITGGAFDRGGDIYFRGDSTVHIKGGLWSDALHLEGNAAVILYGNDFTFTQNFNQYFISGTLQSGDVLDNLKVYAHSGTSIQFVPEPATLLMLGLGVVLLRRRRAA